MNRSILFLQKFKYELLLFALVQHLFIGIFLSDLDFYTMVIWPINMLVLGLGSIFIFTGKHRWRHWFRTIHFIVILLLPIGIPFFKQNPYYFTILNIITPNNHVTKLITAFIGIAGQFYTVVLVGILLSKFTSKQQ
jgi:hypothetical protein